VTGLCLRSWCVAKHTESLFTLSEGVRVCGESTSEEHKGAPEPRASRSCTVPVRNSEVEVTKEFPPWGPLVHPPAAGCDCKGAEINAPSTRTLRASSGTKLQRSRPRRVEQPHLVRARRAVLRRSTAATAMRSGCRRASPPSRCRPGTESRTACARSPNARHAKRLLLHRPALRRCSACSTDTCRPALWHRGCSRRQGGGACRCTGRPCTRHAKRLYVCDASLSARNVTPAAPCR